MFDKIRFKFLWFILGTMIFFLAASWLSTGALVFSKSQVPNWFLTLLCLVTVWKIADLGREFIYRSRREVRRPNRRFTVDQLLGSECHRRLFDARWPCIFND